MIDKEISIMSAQHNQFKILIVFGTRPEAIKMAPVITAFRSKSNFKTSVCFTGQQQEMVMPILKHFNIEIQYNLNVMHKEQSLASLTSALILKLDKVVNGYQPDIILVHGDTTTTLAASLVALYHKIKLGHVEAGLRTRNIYSPWPEEANRKVTSVLTSLHFAPTDLAKENLIKEGVPKSSIVVTGNTVIDALFLTLEQIKSNDQLKDNIRDQFLFLSEDSRVILITGHRRESFGKGFDSICRALKYLSKHYPSVTFVYPVHLNPNVQDTVFNMLDGIPNLHLIKPLDYLPFVYLMNRATLIITDSGGIQEEAPSLGKPVLVIRDITERPEAVKAGTVKIVGTDSENIIRETINLLESSSNYKKMSQANNPYGDGKSSSRIVRTTNKFLIDSD